MHWKFRSFTLAWDLPFTSWISSLIVIWPPLPTQPCKGPSLEGFPLPPPPTPVCSFSQEEFLMEWTGLCEKERYQDGIKVLWLLHLNSSVSWYWWQVLTMVCRLFHKALPDPCPTPDLYSTHLIWSHLSFLFLIFFGEDSVPIEEKVGEDVFVQTKKDLLWGGGLYAFDF